MVMKSLSALSLIVSASNSLTVSWGSVKKERKRGKVWVDMGADLGR